MYNIAECQVREVSTLAYRNTPWERRDTNWCNSWNRAGLMFNPLEVATFFDIFLSSIQLAYSRGFLKIVKV